MNDIQNTDALTYLRSLDDNSIDLIATDPPYYKATDEAWDHQWNSISEFLAWLEKILIEFKRVLKVTGSLYIFASPQMAAKVECLADRYFRVLNQIVWLKGLDEKQGPWNRMYKPSLTLYFPRTERIIFAESRNYQQSKKQQRESHCRKAFAPLIKYFSEAKQQSLLSPTEICDRMEQLTGVRYSFERHTLSASQWHFPTRRQYGAAQRFLQLPRAYENLQEEYQGLKQSLDVKLRHFEAQTENYLYTDVWRFNHIPAGSKRRLHPTQKPLALMRHIIKSSSQPGMIVLDPFAGTGTTLVAAQQLERHWLGCELDTNYFEIACRRLGQVKKIKEVAEKSDEWKQLQLI